MGFPHVLDFLAARWPHGRMSWSSTERLIFVKLSILSINLWIQYNLNPNYDKYYVCVTQQADSEMYTDVQKVKMLLRKERKVGRIALLNIKTHKIIANMIT